MMEYGGEIEIDVADIEPADLSPEEMRKFWSGIVAEADKIILEMTIDIYKSFSYGKRNRIKKGLHPKELYIYRVLKKAKELKMI